MLDYVPFVLIPFIGWGVWRFLRKKGDLTPLKKRTFAIGIVAFFLTEMGRSFYRPFVYANELNDYHIADTVGNSLGTVTAIFMILTLSGTGTRKDWIIVAILTAGLIGYEFLNLASNHAFDFRDVVATLVFGCLSAFAYAYLLKTYGQQRHDRRTEA